MLKLDIDLIWFIILTFSVFQGWMMDAVSHKKDSLTKWVKWLEKNERGATISDGLHLLPQPLESKEEVEELEATVEDLTNINNI